MRRLFWVGALALASCNGSSAQDRIEIVDAPFDSMVDGAWQSSNWFSSMEINQPWLELPPMATLVVHHTLGRAPASVDIYVTVDDPDIDGDDMGAGATLAAGNSARLADVNARWVEIQNDTEVSQRVRIVLR